MNMCNGTIHRRWALNSARSRLVCKGSNLVAWGDQASFRGSRSQMTTRSDTRRVTGGAPVNKQVLTHATAP